jgi:hypothetical protein
MSEQEARQVPFVIADVRTICSLVDKVARYDDSVRHSAHNRNPAIKTLHSLKRSEISIVVRNTHINRKQAPR